jgi:hypothetical protein
MSDEMSPETRAKIMAAAKACWEKGSDPTILQGVYAEEDEEGYVRILSANGRLVGVMDRDDFDALGLAIRSGAMPGKAC